MASDRSARTLYGLSPYADSVRTQTAHFVSYTSAHVPERCLLPAYSLRIRGFIRGSIPLSSTIKRLVRRGSGRAYGQKPEMYGHADRIDGQGKGSEKLPELLDCCVLSAYSCPMTTSENIQRDELAETIHARICEESLSDCLEYRGQCVRAADAILAAGYRKPRTITTVEELDALPNGTTLNVMAGRPFPVYRWDDCWNLPVGYGSWCDSKKLFVAWGGKGFAILHEPETEVGA